MLDNGHEVRNIASLQRGVSDDIVIKMAHEASALLITEDKDFGELVFAHQMAKITVVFLRYRLAELPIIAQNILRVIDEYKPKAGRFFIVVSSTRIRVRSI